jgi:hypothetical protein
LLEAVIVLAITALIAAIAVLSFGNTLQAMHANTGCQATIQVLHQARQQAIDQRTRISVIFNTPAGAVHSMTIARIVPPAAPVVYAQIPLPSDVQFVADPNLPTPPNTPDQVGNGKVAVDFEDGFSITPVAQIYFMPDGSVQNAAGNSVNGVVYIQRGGYWQGARAVSLFGATGRLRNWQLSAVTGGYAWKIQ